MISGAVASHCSNRDDRAACHGSSVGKRSVGDVSSCHVCRGTQHPSGSGGNQLQCGRAVDVMIRNMRKNQQNPPHRDGHL